MPGTREQAGAGRQWKRVEEGSRAKIWNLEADIGQLKVSEGVRQKHVKLGFRGAGRLASSQERS